MFQLFGVCLRDTNVLFLIMNFAYLHKYCCLHNMQSYRNQRAGRVITLPTDFMRKKRKSYFKKHLKIILYYCIAPFTFLDLSSVLNKKKKRIRQGHDNLGCRTFFKGFAKLLSCAACLRASKVLINSIKKPNEKKMSIICSNNWVLLKCGFI